MTEALGKLNHNPIFLSAVGNDLFGRELMLQYDLKKIDKSKIHLSNSSSSAIYSTLLKKSGELMLGMGDMSIHDEISGDYILQHSFFIQSAPIVILDGNIPVHTLSTVLKLCNLSKTPVWFEPTEVRKAKKICKVNPDYLQAISYISPNIHELKSIVEEAKGKDWNGLGSKKKIRFRDGAHSSSEEKWIVECFQTFKGLRMILLTKGKDGIVINYKTDCGHLDSVIHPAPEVNPNDIKSVSGAGDCLNAGFISGILQGLSWISCARIGTQCASMSLKSFQNVPDVFKLRGHDSE